MGPAGSGSRHILAPEPVEAGQLELAEFADVRPGVEADGVGDLLPQDDALPVDACSQDLNVLPLGAWPFPPNSCAKGSSSWSS